jgi:hypothetical protein
MKTLLENFYKLLSALAASLTLTTLFSPRSRRLKRNKSLLLDAKRANDKNPSTWRNIGLAQNGDGSGAKRDIYPAVYFIIQEALSAPIGMQLA